MWHSLEHVEDPLGYLIEAERVLKDGGVLIAEIPHFRSWQARIFRKIGFIWMCRDICFISPKSISILSEKKAFALEYRIRRSSLIYGFLGVCRAP